MNTSKLIDTLNNCIISCNTCFDSCLNEKDVDMTVNCLRNDRACAEVCSATVNLLSSNYPDVKGLVNIVRKFLQNVQPNAKSTNTIIIKNVLKVAENAKKLVKDI